MRLAVFRMAVFASVALSGFAGTEQRDDPAPLRMELDLVDGSRVVGTPDIAAVPLRTSFADISVPLSAVATARIDGDRDTSVFTFKNGDRLQGAVALDKIALETLFGNVSIKIEHIRSLRVMAPGGSLPAGEGSLEFGGVNWKLWRTQFAVQGDKLATLPRARAGFNYGHAGNGRGARLMTNIGSKEWKDYRVEFEFCMTGVDPAFNRYGLPADFGRASILFRVADAKESWNERGLSSYRLALNIDGTWSLNCSYHGHCRTTSGYGNYTTEGNRALANGKGLKLDAINGNKFRIDVTGARIRIWVDGEKIADVQDEKMREPVGGTTLDHGGVGFAWQWECMGWIRNFSARQI